MDWLDRCKDRDVSIDRRPVWRVEMHVAGVKVVTVEIIPRVRPVALCSQCFNLTAVAHFSTFLTQPACMPIVLL